MSVSYLTPMLAADHDAREAAFLELRDANDQLQALRGSADSFAILRAVERVEAAMNRVRGLMEET